MRALRIVRRWTWSALLATTVLAGGTVASADGRDETERWVPAFAVYGQALVQGVHGKATSSQILGPWNSSAGNSLGQPIRPATSGSDVMVTPLVGGELEVMTPGLTALPGKPRFFVHGGAAAAFGADRDVAKDGVPGALAPPSNSATVPNERNLQNQGSKTTVSVKTLQIRAGAGLAFTLDVLGRRLRLKPSMEYMREVLDAKGIVVRGAQFAPTRPGTLDGIREIHFEGSEEKVYHGLGPGLEVEMDAGRAGPLMLTVFAGGQAYHFLGELDFDLSDVNEFDESAEWSIEKKPWAIQGGVGLRFRWLPEE